MIRLYFWRSDSDSIKTLRGLVRGRACCIGACSYVRSHHRGGLVLSVRVVFLRGKGFSTSNQFVAGPCHRRRGILILADARSTRVRACTNTRSEDPHCLCTPFSSLAPIIIILGGGGGFAWLSVVDSGWPCLSLSIFRLCTCFFFQPSRSTECVNHLLTVSWQKEVCSLTNTGLEQRLSWDPGLTCRFQYNTL